MAARASSRLDVNVRDDLEAANVNVNVNVRDDMGAQSRQR